MQTDLSERWLSIAQWCRAVALERFESHLHVTRDSNNNDCHDNKRKRAPSPPRALMSTPPPSDVLRPRDGSPSKKRKLPDLSIRARSQDGDDPFVLPDTDSDMTPRRSTTGMQAPAPGSVISLAFPTTPSVSSTTTSKSRRSQSPTKRTQSLAALKKPVVHATIKSNATSQLPADVHDLYNRTYEIAEDREGIFPWAAREEITRVLGRTQKESKFYGRGDNNATSDRAAALEELTALRELHLAASECQLSGCSEAAWNLEVHGPLLKLGASRHRRVRRQLITTAQIANSFVPAMDEYAVAQRADKKMVDFALVLDPLARSSQIPGDEEEEAVPEEDARLAQAIKEAVYAQPPEKQTINQTTYPPIHLKPIGVSVETKGATGAPEEGRAQLAVWAAAWHERNRVFLRPDDSEEGSRIVTLPLLLIVEHTWMLSFACDRGDKLEIVGEMQLGSTASLEGLYGLVAVVRELAGWVDGEFRRWIGQVLGVDQME